MREYEMSMEEQIKLLVKKFDSLDKRFETLESKFNTLDNNVTSKLDTLDSKVEKLDQNVRPQLAKIMVRLDETHAVAKLGLEGFGGLRESMDAKFEAAAKNSADQMGLLKSVLVHVRQRVDAPDRPNARRRKS